MTLVVLSSDWIHSLSSAVGLPAGFGTFSVAVFNILEANASPEGKLWVAKWLRSEPNSPLAENWPKAFSQAIDNIFGPDPINFMFFMRSCLASIIAVAIVSGVYLHLHHLRLGGLSDVAVLLLVSCIASLLPDYVSLLISRQIVLLMQRHDGLLRVLGLLAMDAFLKLILATCVIYLGDTFLNVIFGDSYSLKVLNQEALSSVQNFYSGRGSNTINWRILFYASFFTSLSVWLFVFGGLLVRVLQKAGRAGGLIAKFTDLTKPFKAIGQAVALVGIVGAASVSGISYAMALLH